MILTSSKQRLKRECRPAKHGSFFGTHIASNQQNVGSYSISSGWIFFRDVKVTPAVPLVVILEGPAAARYATRTRLREVPICLHADQIQRNIKEQMRQPAALHDQRSQLAPVEDCCTVKS